MGNCRGERKSIILKMNFGWASVMQILCLKLDYNFHFWCIKCNKEFDVVLLCVYIGERKELTKKKIKGTKMCVS